MPLAVQAAVAEIQHQPPPPSPSTITPSSPLRPARQRTSVACRNCRRRKIRCSGPLGPKDECENCLKKDLRCEYVPVQSLSTPLETDLLNPSPDIAPLMTPSTSAAAVSGTRAYSYPQFPTGHYHLPSPVQSALQWSSADLGQHHYSYPSYRQYYEQAPQFIPYQPHSQARAHQSRILLPPQFQPYQPSSTSQPPPQPPIQIQPQSHQPSPQQITAPRPAIQIQVQTQSQESQTRHFSAGPTHLIPQSEQPETYSVAYHRHDLPLYHSSQSSPPVSPHDTQDTQDTQPTQDTEDTLQTSQISTQVVVIESDEEAKAPQSDGSGNSGESNLSTNTRRRRSGKLSIKDLVE